MGISPISNLLPLSPARPTETGLALPDMERVENSVRTGDETYSPSDGRSANDADEEFENLAEEDKPVDPNAEATDSATGGQVSFFA